MSIREHDLLLFRHNREADLFERALGAAKALAKGDIPEETLEQFVTDHLESVNRRSPRDIEHEATAEWTNWIGAYGMNALDILRLEKERPGYQRVRILFGLYADGMTAHIGDEIREIVTMATEQYREAVEILDGAEIDRQDLKLEFAGLMAAPPQDEPWKRVKSPEAAREFELNYLGRVSDAYMGYARCIRRLSEIEMARFWLLHNAYKGQRGIVKFSEAKSLKALKAEGRRSASALSRVPPYISMNAQTLGTYADTISRNTEAREEAGSARPTSRPI